MRFALQKIIILFTLFACGKSDFPKPNSSAPAKKDASDQKPVIPRDTEACRLSANPSEVPVGGEIILTLTLNIEVNKIDLDGESLSSKGGDVARKPEASRFYFAFVEDKDGKEYECSTAVRVLAPDMALAPRLTAATPTNNKRPTWFWLSGGGGNGNYRYCFTNNDCKSSDPTTKASSYTIDSDLIEGNYFFSVQEQNKRNGEWGPRATILVDIDLTAPRPPTFVPFANNITKDQLPLFRWTPVDDTTASARFFHLQIDNANFLQGGFDTVDVSLSSPMQLSHGAHIIYIWQRDQALNWSPVTSMSFQVDIQAPGKPVVSCTSETRQKKPTWSWQPAAGESNPAFRFRLDNANLDGLAESTATSFQPTSDLGEGNHILYVAQRDLAGNWSEKGSCTTAIDTTPPNNPNITGSLFTNVVQPTWLWSTGGGDGAGKFVFRLDNSDLSTQPVSGVTSFKPSTALAAGVHTIYVAEEDRLGNRSATSSFSTTIDLTAPIVAFNANHPAINIANQASFVISGTCSEANQDVTISGALSGNVKCSAQNTWTLNLDFTSAGDGSLNLKANHRDAAGNSAPEVSLALTKDTQRPIISFDANLPVINLANKASYPLSGNCSENGRSVTISGAASGSSTCANLRWSVTANFNNAADGSNSINVRADLTDASGNAANQANINLSKDTVAPSITLNSTGVINFGNKNNYSLAGNCSENNRDVVISGAVTKSVACSGGAWTTSVDLSGISDGENIPITATHTDGANNVANVTVNHRKDTILPTVAFTAPAPHINIANKSAYILSGACSENNMNVDVSGAVTGSTQCANNAWNFVVDLSNKNDGISNIAVAANHKDTAGNAAMQATIQLSKDTVAPALTLSAPGFINNQNKSAFTLAGTCSSEENGQVVLISGAASATGVCNSGNWSVAVNYAAVGDGDVQVSINMADKAGNPATTINATLKKDTVLPNVTFNLPTQAIGLSNQANFPLSGTCSENGRVVSLGNAVNKDVACVAGAWSTNVSFQNSSDGTVVVTADHTDVAGNNASQTSVSINKDTQLPTVNIQPLGMINIANQATFPASGACSENGQNVILGGAISGVALCVGGGWTKQLNYSAVADGNSILLTADHQDASGNSANQASLNLTKDTVAPTFTVATLSYVNTSNQNNYTLSGTCSDNARNVMITGAITATASCSNNLWSKNVDLSGLADGNINLAANFSDLAGNPAETKNIALSKDSQVPTVVIGALGSINNNNKTVFNVYGTCSENGRNVIIGGAVSDSVACSGGNWSKTINFSAVADGNIIITADHSDLAGNNATQAAKTVVKNTTLPVVSINNLGFVNNSNKAAFSVSGTCTEAGQSVILSAVSGTITGSATCSGGNYSTELNFSTAPDGIDSIVLTAEHLSASGNSASPATKNLSKDTVNPTLSFANNLPVINNTNKNNYSLQGSCSENGRSVTIGGAVTATVSCSNGTYSVNVDFSGLADGNNINVTAIHRDLADNSSSASVTLNKDTGVASVTIDSLPTINIANRASYVVSGDCSENLRTVNIGGAKSTTANCVALRWSATVDYTSIADGTNNVLVTANHADAAGNAAPQASRSISKDTVAPNVTVVPAAAYINIANKANFGVSGTCSENTRNVIIASGSINKTVVCSNGNYAASLDLNSLADTVALLISASVDDAAGNNATISATVTKDTLAPALTIGNLGIINAANQSAFTVSGTCSENTLGVAVGGDKSGAATCTNGTWSININYSGVADGNVSVTATHTDAAGNTSQANATATKNTSAPTVSIGNIGHVNDANKAAFALFGTCSESGRPVNYAIAAASLSGSTNCVAGNWSLTLNLSSANDGTLNIVADHSNAAGNPASPANKSINKDTLVPTLAFNNNHPAVTIANAANYLLEGTCSENGRDVQLSGAISANVSCNNGSFAKNVNFSSIADGNITMRANHTDAAGNNAPQATMTLIKDTEAPSVSIDNLGYINGINKNNFAVSGDCSENGRTVNLGGTLSGSADCSSKRWSTNLNYSGVADGNVTLTANLTDAAGNPATQATRSVQKDTNPPTVTLTSSQTYANLANVSVFPLSGTCSEIGQTVTITSGSVAKNITCASTNYSTTINLSTLTDSASLVLTASHADPAGNTSTANFVITKDTAAPTVTIGAVGNINLTNQANFNVFGTCSENNRTISVSGSIVGTAPCSSGVWSVNLDYRNIADGNVVILADISDVAGNAGTQATKTVTKNTSQPSVTIGNVTAINIANKVNYAVFGTCSEAGREINITSTPGTTTGTTTCSGSTWSTNIDFTNTADGNLAITATHSNVAGNSASYEKSVLKDTVAPTVVFASNLGTINSVNVSNYSVSGTCSENNTTVGLSGSITTNVTCISGNFSKSVNFTNVADGTVSLIATQVDTAGNSTSTPTLNLTKDATNPTVDIDPPGYINLGNRNSFAVSGPCSENGRLVNIGGAQNSSATCANQRWSKTLNYSTVADGTVLLTVDHSDANGNNALQASRNLFKDTVAPTMTLNSMAAYINNNNKTNFAFNGNCSENGSAVQLQIAGTASTVTTTCSSNAWSYTFDLSSLSDGTVILNATHLDVVNNSVSTNLNIAKDTSNPSVDIIQPVTVNNANKANFVITGSCSEASRAITLTGTLSNTATCSASGTWSATYNYSAVSDGTNNVSINANTTDVAGNASATATKIFSKDTINPSITINSLTPINSQNVNNYSLSGTCSESGRVVSISWSSSGGGTSSVSNFACVASNWSGSLNMSGAGDGTVTFSATHTDAASNTNTASQNTTKETGLPSVTANAWPKINFTNRSAYTLSGTCTEVGRNVMISGAVNTSALCSANLWSTVVNFASVPDGTNAALVKLNHADSFGNNAPEVTIYLDKDTIVPIITLAAYVGSITAANHTTYLVGGTCSENNQNIQFTIGSFSQTAVCASLVWSKFVDVSSIADGSVQISAAHSDNALNTMTISKTVSKDTVLPTINFNSTPLFINASNANKFLLQGNCSEAGLLVQLTGSVTASATCLTNGLWSREVSFSNLNDGAVIIRADHADAAGNNAQQSITLTKDVIIPSVSFGALPALNASNYTNFVMFGTCSEVNRTVTITGALSITAICSSNNTWTSTSQNFANVSDGNLNFFANFSDAAGNPATQAQITLVKDTVIPTVSIAAIASYVNVDNQFNFTFDGSCSEKNRLVVLSGAISDTVTCNSSWSLTSLNLSALSDGSLTVYANHSDAAGNNAAQKSVTIIKDTMRPTVTITAPGIINSVNSSNFPVSGTCSDSNAIIQLGGNVSGAVTCLASLTWSANINYANVSDGFVLLTANLTDAAGNAASQASVSITVDKTPPTVVQTSGVPSGSSSAINLNVDVLPNPIINGLKEVYAYKYKVSSASQSCTTGDYSAETAETTNITASLSTLSDGPVLLCICARDQAGNWQTPSLATAFTWIKVTSVPSTPAISVLAFNNQIDVSWERSNNDNLSTEFILVRKGGADFSWMPVNGQTYVSGQDLGGGMQVVYAGPNLSYADEWAINNQPYFYHLHAVNSGKVYSSFTMGTATPLPVNWEVKFKKVATGLSHTCGLQTNGNISCWGNDSLGMLGDGGASATNRSAPSLVDMGSTATDRFFVDVDAGNLHSCGLTAGGVAYCWGFNLNGQLGNGAALGQATAYVNPGAVFQNFMSGVKAFTQINTGNDFTCGLTAGGTIWCWGKNSRGQLGNGTSTDNSRPSQTVSLGNDKFTQISSGASHSCAVTALGKIACWGDNTYSQLGLGVNGQAVGYNLLPQYINLSNISSPPTFVSVSANEDNSCALASNGDVWCWGDNTYQQIGNNSGTTFPVATPTKVNNTTLGSNKTFVSIAAGASTCGISADGKIWCWGLEASGRLGNGVILNANQNLPTPIDTDSTINFKQVSTGPTTCAVSAAGRAYCWGSDTYGQAGNGAPLLNAQSPVLVQPPANLGEYKNFTKISVGVNHNCALDQDANGQCWGANAYAQIGSNMEANFHPTPYQVNNATIPNAKKLIDITAGSTHSCAINAVGDAYCWGSDLFAALGNGQGGNGIQYAPVNVDKTNSKLYTKVVAGTVHSCALASDGSLWCWGYNGNGNLGIGTDEQYRHVPSQVATSGITTGSKEFVSVATNAHHTCAISSSGHLYCWGYNLYGTLGNNSTANQNSPVPVFTSTGGNENTHLDQIIKVATGNFHTCAINAAGVVFCWGSNSDGQLGQGYQGGQLATAKEVVVTQLSTASEKAFVDIAAGVYHTCALNAVGTVYCWGANANGQFGNNSSNSTFAPAPMSTANYPTTARSAIKVGTNGEHSCMLMATGKAWCTGADNSGELGDNATLSNRYTPGQVSY